MRVLFQVTIYDTDDIAFDLPMGARALSVQIMDDERVLYLEVDNDRDWTKRQFYAVMSGGVVPSEAGDYVCTWKEGELTFHLYDAAL